MFWHLHWAPGFSNYSGDGTCRHCLRPRLCLQRNFQLCGQFPWRVSKLPFWGRERTPVCSAHPHVASFRRRLLPRGHPNLHVLCRSLPVHELTIRTVWLGFARKRWRRESATPCLMRTPIRGSEAGSTHRGLEALRRCCPRKHSQNLGHVDPGLQIWTCHW